jgi:ABC-type transport system involved in multi-copper enzyme maturation permease subunit
MNTLVKKEIRLLLPAFVGALALGIVPIWLVRYERWNPNPQWPFYLCLFGIVLLALSSFGRELGLKTLPFILTQPVERARMWRTKIKVLAVSVAVIYIAWLVSGNLRSLFQPKMMAEADTLAGLALMAVVLTASGLWMTLLLRHTVAALLLTTLVPVAALTFINAIGGIVRLILGVTALGVYPVIAFFLAKRQFLRMQDTAWTGGVIAFSGGRAAAERAALRERRPWDALFWKEMQLQQVTLIGMACLLVLHIGAAALHQMGAHAFTRSTLEMLELFGALWIFVPVLAGSQSVAEERKFGTMQSHLCLPISRRAQWFLKLLVVLVVGGLLSWALFVSVNLLAGITDLDKDYGQSCLLFLLLALAGFYGSTLTGAVVQALAAAALTLLGFWVSGILPYGWRLGNAQGGTLWLYIASPLLLATLVRLSYRNFGHATESGPLWRRNVLALGGMAAFSIVLTVSIYHRAWEWLTPLEPPPGPARLSLQQPPKFYSYGGRGVSARLPDGRLWVDRLNYGKKWISLGGNEFAPGSNWVDAVANSRETVAIRSDGTLWVSEKPLKLWDAHGAPLVEPSSGLVQFGQETNWLSVARFPDSGVFLLRRDGTLWLWDWGTNYSFNARQAPQRSLRDFQPRRLGDDSDWAKLLGSKGWIYAFAWKRDGSAWVLKHPELGRDPVLLSMQPDLHPGLSLLRLTGLDNTRWRSLTASDQAEIAGVRDDGTLWCWQDQNRSLRWQTWSWPKNPALVQIGKDSDWAELAASWTRLVARKTDGSLWTWNVQGNYFWEPFEVLHQPPVRLGTHSDWVALGVVGPDIISLAADGNLWSWPDSRPVAIFGENSDLFLAASRKPAKIENIFDPRQ